LVRTDRVGLDQLPCRSIFWLMASFLQALRELVRSIRADEPCWDDPTAFWPIFWGNTEARAVQLLIQNLSPQQRKQYKASGHFEVVGGDTGTRYRIRHRQHQNVDEFDQSGRRIRIWCFTPQGRLPVGNIMLAQKIALELFECEALHVARGSPSLEYALEGGIMSMLRRCPRR
jgi:hypothetical protein